MFELLQKAVFASVGIGYMTKEKIEEVAGKLAQEAKAGEEEGRKFIQELGKKSEDARLAMENMVGKAVNSALARLEIPSRGEVDTLKQKVADLEKAVKDKA